MQLIQNLKLLYSKGDILTIISIGVFSVHRPGFLMPGYYIFQRIQSSTRSNLYTHTNFKILNSVCVCVFICRTCIWTLFQ